MIASGTQEHTLQWIGFLGGVTAIVATVFASLYGMTKNSLIPLAAASALFLIMPILGISGILHGWWLLVLYIMQGMGRAVYESTNKAVFAEFYP